MTVADLRWGRCDIKTTALCGTDLAQVEARSAGFDQVLFVDEQNNVTEGSASNAWIVRDGILITREPGPEGPGRRDEDAADRASARPSVKVVERTFSVNEALGGR